MNEAQFQAAVLDVLTMHRWWTYHVYDSRRSNPGWPDIVAMRPPRLLFLELKADQGRLSPAQKTCLRDLAACGQEVAVLRPSNLPSLDLYFGHRSRRLPGLQV